MQLYALLLIPILLSLGVVALAMMGSGAGGPMRTVALVLGLAALALSVYGAFVVQGAVSDLQRTLGGLERLGEGLDQGLPDELKKLLPGPDR